MLTVAAIVGFVLLIAGLLFFLQHSMIYLPRSYGVEVARMLPQGGKVVSYTAGGKRQHAYYMAPQTRGSSDPSRLWLMFGGNGSLALDWLDLVEGYPDPAAGYLMIEYPGYGENSGKASPATILESTDKALAQLRQEEGSSVTATRLAVIGHSLGCAAALQFAARTEVERIVLVSPFTTMTAMARRVVGVPLAYLLRHRFDNVARLDEIAKRSPRPALTVIHGDSDDIVPVSMSRELVARYAGWAEYHEIKGGDHNMIMLAAEPLIKKAIAP
jgi:uncharacterized protein